MKLQYKIAIIGTVILFAWFVIPFPWSLLDKNSAEPERYPEPEPIGDTLCFPIPNTTSGMLCYPSDELEKFSCTKLVLEYLYESSNLLDDDFDGNYLQNFIGLPDGVTHEQFDRCVKFILNERNTGKASTFDYEIKAEGVTYGNQYEIFNGTVDEITYDADSNSLVISLHESDKGYVQIVIPGLLSLGNTAPLADYFVLQNGEEVSFERLSPILLKIPFEKDTKKIEIFAITKTNENQQGQIIKSGFQVKASGVQQVRGGTTHEINVAVTRDGNPVDDAMVRITIEDYGEDILREFKGRTDPNGRFVFSWEAPKFDNIKTLLAYVDATDDMSAETILFKFQVYCLPGESGCKIDGN